MAGVMGLEGGNSQGWKAVFHEKERSRNPIGDESTHQGDIIRENTVDRIDISEEHNPKEEEFTISARNGSMKFRITLVYNKQGYWVISGLEDINVPTITAWTREAWQEVKSIVAAYISTQQVKIYKDVESTIRVNINARHFG